MKRVAERSVTVCDICQREAEYASQCDCCGKDICSTCGRDPNKAISYAQGVHVSGSGNGLYCTPCAVKLLVAGTDKLHGAYLAVARLRHEMLAWSASFQNRREAAELRVQQLRK